MKKYIFGLFLLLCIPNLKIKAYCDDSDIPKLQKIANNINFSYDYVEKDNNVTFNVTINNMNKYVYVKDNYNNKTHHYNDNNVLNISGYKDGITLEYSIYGKSICEDELLKTVYIKLPKYNKYYNNELCKGIENHKYCKKWVNISLSYYEFYEEVYNYKQSLIKEKEEEPKIIQITVLDKIISFYLKYYLYILVTIIVLFILLIIYLKNKDNYNLNVRKIKRKE